MSLEVIDIACNNYYEIKNLQISCSKERPNRTKNRLRSKIYVEISIQYFASLFEIIEISRKDIFLEIINLLDMIFAHVLQEFFFFL